MTTIETTHKQTQPDWERLQQECNGLMPPVSDETAHDVDYLVARLRAVIIAAASDAAAESDRKRAEQTEGISLRIRLEQVIEELRPHGRAATDLLASLRQLFPAIEWHRDQHGFWGYASWWALVDPVEPAARGLGLCAGDSPGVWAGEVDGWPVRLHIRSGDEADALSKRTELGDDVTAFLVDVGADLVPIPWRTDLRPHAIDGHAIDGGGLDSEQVARQWADALGLTDVVRNDGGTADYTGTTAIGPVRLWWIWDRAVWKESTARAARDYAEWRAESGNRPS